MYLRKAVDLLRTFDLSATAGQPLLVDSLLQEVRKLLAVLDIESSSTASEQTDMLAEIITSSNEGGYCGLFAPFVSVANFGRLKEHLEQAYAQKAKSMTSRSLEVPIMSVLKLLHDNTQDVPAQKLAELKKRMQEFLKVAVAI
jgi:hypothetical protein